MLISHSSPPFFFRASHSRSKTLPLFILRLFPHLPLFLLLSPSSTPFSLAFFTSLTSCHLFLAPFIFVPTFLLFLYTHPSLTLFFSAQFFSSSSSSPHLPPVLFLSFASPLPWSSIFPFLPVLFPIPFSVLPPPIPPPLCFFYLLRIAFSLTFPSFSLQPFLHFPPLC